jgi:hypothetical protein
MGEGEGVTFASEVSILPASSSATSSGSSGDAVNHMRLSLFAVFLRAGVELDAVTWQWLWWCVMVSDGDDGDDGEWWW